MTELKVVINGAGAAGTAIAKLLRCVGQNPDICEPVRDIIVCDSQGAIHRERTNLSDSKRQFLSFTNRGARTGDLAEVLAGADVFVGVSRGNLLDENHIRSMAKNPIVFAMANPEPEIRPDLAHRAGAAVVGTGRSDFPNQVNNLLAFPGIFRGALDAGAPRITDEMKLAAAHALAQSVGAATAERVLPDSLDRSIAPQVAAAVSAASSSA